MDDHWSLGWFLVTATSSSFLFFSFLFFSFLFLLVSLLVCIVGSDKLIECNTMCLSSKGYNWVFLLSIHNCEGKAPSSGDVT